MLRIGLPLLWTCFIVSLAPLFAQNTAFTYQGSLLDNAQPANGAYDLQFSLTDDPTNGNYVGAVLTNAPTSVSNGLFIVTLAFGDGVFDGSARWLEIGVRTNGSASPYTVLSPRQTITATPYAAFANTAATAGVASGLAPGATANGAGITNLNGAAIQPGTVNSNALDAATRAMLGTAGSGIASLGGSMTNATLWAGTSSFGPAYATLQGTNFVVAGCSDALANGNYLLQSYDAVNSIGYYAGPHYGVIYDPQGNVYDDAITITNGAGTELFYAISSPALVALSLHNYSGDAANGTISWTLTQSAYGFVFSGIPVQGDGSGLTNLNGAALNMAGMVFADTAGASTNANGILTSNLFTSLSINAEFRRTACRIPYMGINFGAHANGEAGLISLAQILNTNGFVDAGYNLVQQDTGWALSSRVNGLLVPNTNAGWFPNGFANTLAALQANRCRFGLYIGPSSTTMPCSASPGTTPATAWVDGIQCANLGADWVKIDFSNGNYSDTDARTIVEQFTAAMDYQRCVLGKPRAAIIEVSWGVRPLQPWLIGVANCIQYTGDTGAGADWRAVVNKLFANEWLTGPGHYVRLGISGMDTIYYGNFNTTNDTRALFAMQCMNAGPLVFEVNPTLRPTQEWTIWTNREAIKINQDALCLHCWPVYTNTDGSRCFVKPLANGDVAVALMNQLTNASSTFAVPLNWIPNLHTNVVRVLDIFDSAISSANDTLSVTVPAKGVNLYRMSQ